MKWAMRLILGEREIAPDRPSYFIADIASSHDGELNRALDLIWLAKEAGADCAKFQHFLAKDIVSDRGFTALGGRSAHQAAWKQSVYHVFERYETPRDWTPALAAECAKAGLDFMSTPYDFAAIELIDSFVRAFKIGSGDVTWPAFIQAAASKGKPLFLATGASDMAETIHAVEALLATNAQCCVMQCNTNYTGDPDNFRHVNLNVLRTFAMRWPGIVLGLSDHTPGHAAVLGAVALGARVIEKHFTDDNDRDGPDHRFSMNPATWREMVDRTRELEMALGDGIKRIEENEKESAIVQRRCLRFRADLPSGHILTTDDLEALRPCPPGAMEPHELSETVGLALRSPARAGDALFPQNLAPRALSA